MNGSDITIDCSNTGEGYVTAVYTGDPSRKCKIQMNKGNDSQNFTVSDSMKAFPLCFGDGTYSIKAYQQIAGTGYKQIAALQAIVKLRETFVPWLHPNTYADYTADSKCVAIAAQLCAGLKTDIERIRAIYKWIIANVEYDKQLAVQVQSDKWWLPDPDEVVAKGKSICFGYSSLMAAMCRSQGIPAKVVVGPVTNLGLHAWNSVWSKSCGDIGGISIDSNTWSRIDVTFMDSSNGTAAGFVQDDANYTMQYCG